MLMMTTKRSQMDPWWMIHHVHGIPGSITKGLRWLGKLHIRRSNFPVSRNKLLSFITEQGSRQEYEPLLGKLVDCGFAEPFHNSNNAWTYFHRLMLETALSKSGVTGTCKHIEDVPPDSPFLSQIHVCAACIESEN